jgi:hypothetical protein
MLISLHKLVLSRFRSAPSARLSHLPFEGARKPHSLAHIRLSLVLKLPSKVFTNRKRCAAPTFRLAL